MTQQCDDLNNLNYLLQVINITLICYLGAIILHKISWTLKNTLIEIFL